MATPASVARAHAAIECLRRLSDVFQQRRRQLAEGAGLTELQWLVLERISTQEFMPSMFARSRDVGAAAVSKTLRQLADKALIQAEVDKEDARQRRYTLTTRGKRTLEGLRRQRELAIEAVWLKLPESQLAAFTQIGTELTERLEALARGEPRAAHEGSATVEPTSEGGPQGKKVKHGKDTV